MDLSREELEKLTIAMWTSMLGLPLESGERQRVPGDVECMSSSVHISGGCVAAVTLQAPTKLARSATEAMFMMEAGEAADDELVDAFGELANVLGGNVKALLPGPSRLSLPSVARGRGLSYQVPGTERIFEIDFESGGMPLNVAVHMMKE